MVYRPTARVLTVLELLQSYGRMSGTELSRRLEVDARTTRSYIETLQDLGIPVEAERGRNGAYYLRPGYKIPPLIFTEDEALALALSLLLGRQSGLAKTEPAFEGALAKLERVLPEATRERVKAISQTVIFENSPVSFPFNFVFQAAPSTTVVAMLSSAVQTEQCVFLEYRSVRGEVTRRVFNPYGVVYHEGLWYTIGYCHLRQGQRLFRLDRIIKVEMLEEGFTRPKDFEVLPEVQKALATVPSIWQVEIWFNTSLEEAQRQLRLSKVYFEEAQDGGVFMRGEAEDLEWLARLVAGVSVRFRILKPARLRSALKAHAQRLTRYAQQEEF